MTAEAKFDDGDLMAEFGKWTDERFAVEAEKRGFTVDRVPRKENVQSAILSELAKPGQTVKIGVVSDTHFGSKYQQITHLRDFYRYADSQGVACYLHAGDAVDGIHKMHRDAVFGHFKVGFDSQVDYFVEEYPVSQNGPTYLIDGNHDSSFFADAGVSVGEHIAREREDILYMGYYAATFDVGPARIHVAHGARGGLSYARSYKQQKLLEQMDERQRADLDIALWGHWHVADHLPGYQGVHSLLVPCFQRQTPFLKTLGVQPVVGGIVLEIEFGQRGVWNMRTDWRLYREPLAEDFPGAVAGEADR